MKTQCNAIRLFCLGCLFLVMGCGCLKYDFERKKNEHENPAIVGLLPDLSVPEHFSWDGVYITIPLSAIDDLNKINIDIPALKYNKKFAYTYTFDDCVVQAYGKAFCTINGMWVDDERFFHFGQERTTGKEPVNTLGYTDGCGNEKRFAFGVAIWPCKDNGYVTDLMAPSNRNAGNRYPYLVWSDVVPLLDYGSDIYFHNVDENIYDKTDPHSLVDGLRVCQNKAIEKIGRGIKTLARADGNNNYYKAGLEFEDVVIMTASNSVEENVPPLIVNLGDGDLDLYKKCLFRRYTEEFPDVMQLMPDLEVAHGELYSWYHDFSHGPENFQYILDLFKEINDRYGKDGDDSVWFASLDEIYEYVDIRQNCEITKTTSGDSLKLKFKCSTPELADKYQYHRDFSLMLSGVDGSSVKIGSGKNVYGLSYAKTKDGRFLVNINCNASLLERAERYTGKYEKAKTPESKEEALFFINQLKPELRGTFLARCK
ncbi:hypothetical protein [Parabacteroides sp.]